MIFPEGSRINQIDSNINRYINYHIIIGLNLGTFWNPWN
nr:MAG TPA: hypothetical protein [Caudoviricetes sp.]